MNGIEPQQLFGALSALVVALFLTSQLASTPRLRLWLRRAAITVFLIAVAAVLVEIGSWLAAPR